MKPWQDGLIALGVVATIRIVFLAGAWFFCGTSHSAFSHLGDSLRVDMAIPTGIFLSASLRQRWERPKSPKFLKLGL